MSYSAEEFLNKIKPLVIEDMKQSGILASLTAAQAFIESNKGNSGLTEKANNLFGIKGTYNGESVKMKTKEFENGEYVVRLAAFRKYPSWEMSIADHSAMFNRMKRYANLRRLRDYREACRLVREDGYATSPSYTTTLISTIERYKLYEWDGETAGETNPYSEPTKTLKKGSKGDGVKWLQWHLNRHGAGLDVDGDFGNLTDKAVRDFQTQAFVDGKVGKLTRNALKSE